MSSLTFGPKWVRDLSSGDTGAAAPPNTPAPRKYKLAEFRYGREEMLALVADIYEIPLGLKEFEDIINDRPVPPLAFVPISEEEERCQMGGVNSALVLKITGRGGPGMRGRGGIRGRGRGRGDYSLHRSSSTSDGSYEQNRWPETGSTRGGYHRSVSGHNSVEGGPVRVGYDPTRSRLNSDGSYPNRNVEYWRSNSKESPPAEGQVEGGDDEWRNTKPWTGKKGSADGNRNWRDARERQNHEERTRTKSWSRTNHEKEDGLPEWCIDDSNEDYMHGSFDASGQFRVYGKDEGLEDDEQDLEEQANDDGGGKTGNAIETDEISDKIETRTKETDPKNNDHKDSDSSLTSNGSVAEKNKLTTLKTYVESLDEQTNDNDVFTAPNVDDVNTENENKRSENNKQQKTKSHIRNPPGTIPGFPKPTDDEYEMNLEHITSMVAKLDDDSDEEELVLVQTPPQNPSVDPSIVFAKKAEPGKNINGLQDWIYRDPQGEIQGPFSNEEMLEWFKAGYFTMGLLVRRVCDEMFLPLGDVIKLWGRIPFTAKSQPPPITSQMLYERVQLQQQQEQRKQLQRLIQQQQQEQQQKQQLLRQNLLQQLQVQSEAVRPNDLSLPPELSVWGDVSTGATPVSSGGSPWTPMQERNAWTKQESPQNIMSLRQLEEEQQRVGEVGQETPTAKSKQHAVLESHSEQQLKGGELKQQSEETNVQNQHIAENEGSPKKKNKKKNKNKESTDFEVDKKNDSDQRQKEKEELQRKALEALHHQQQLQQQKKVQEQRRLLEEQSRREEEIRVKQQQQQQHMQQQMIAKLQQDHQRKQQQQQQQSWSRLPSGASSAPSLVEIQRIQERKEVELQEHMKAIHQHEMMQQQQQRAQAKWNQQQGLHQQPRVKSLLEIQREEAKKLIKQQQEHSTQQQQQQMQSQNYNSLPWNAAGQPIQAKPTKQDTNALFWDDVIGLSTKVNGSVSNEQKNQQKGYRDFPPVSTSSSTKAMKRDNRDQEILNRIFQAPTPSSEFISWVERNLPAVKKAIDVPTVVSFLQEIDSPYEIHEYMRSYLGDSREQKEFVREFLERRNKTENYDNKKTSSANLSSKRSELNHTTNSSLSNVDLDGFEDVSKKNKKKKKMQKVDPNLLGFQCNAAPEMINRDGEVEGSTVATAKVKK